MTDQITQITNLSDAAEAHLLKIVNGYLKDALHSAPSTLYAIRKEWKALTRERELLLEFFKEARAANLDKATLLAKDLFKPIREEMAGVTHEVVPQLNDEFDYIQANVMNAGIICGDNMQQAELLKSNLDFNYMKYKFRSRFTAAEFDLLHFKDYSRFSYFGNVIVMEIIFISIIKFLLHEIKETGSGEILIIGENWDIKQVIEFQCTSVSSKEIIENIFNSITEDGVDLGFCKKAAQLFNGDIRVELNSKNSIIFTLILPAIRSSNLTNVRIV